MFPTRPVALHVGSICRLLLCPCLDIHLILLRNVGVLVFNAGDSGVSGVSGYRNTCIYWCLTAKTYYRTQNSGPLSTRGTYNINTVYNVQSTSRVFLVKQEITKEKLII